MPIDTATWRIRSGIYSYSQRISLPVRVFVLVTCHASVIRIDGCVSVHIGFRLALCMSILLLCAGIESNPGPPKYDDLASKVDTLLDELKSLRKDTTDRLDALRNDMSTRLAINEKSV